MKVHSEVSSSSSEESVGSSPSAAAAQEPAAQEPAAQEPAAQEPAAQEPAAQRGSQFDRVTLERVLLLAALITLSFVILRNAWVSEDAYITYRALDNLIHGYGLRWNVLDRVQTFSNPLWLFWVAPVYALVRDAYAASLLASLVACGGLLVLLLRRGTMDRASGILAIVLFCSSRAFIDYATSGLENPLTQLLLVWFLVLYWTAAPGVRRLFGLTLLTSLISLCRLDAILFVLPSLVLAFRACDQRGKAAAVAWGVAPLVVWELFSLLYYGSLVPNTAYAKLNSGIPKSEMLAQGGLYFVDLLSNDPLTLAVVVFAFAVPWLHKTARVAGPLCGLVCYLAYIVWIGGDFMSGRFFSTPFVLAVLCLMRIPWSHPRVAILGGAAALAISAIGPNPPFQSGADATIDRFPPSGIADERRFYYPGTGLLMLHRTSVWPANGLVNDGLRDRKAAKSSTERYVVARGNIGFHGYMGGPGLHLIDLFALGDPLLARLPASYMPNWRVGHYQRVLPNGYPETIQAGEGRFEDPNLNLYYEKLSLVTQGSLLDGRRLVALWELSTGQLDHLIDRQRYRFGDWVQDRKPLEWDDLLQAPMGGEHQPLAHHRGRSMLIRAPQRQHVESLRLRYSSPTASNLYFLDDEEILGKVPLEAGPPGKLRTHEVTVPARARRKGFDALYILSGEVNAEHRIGGARVR